MWKPKVFVSYSNHDVGFVKDIGKGSPFFLRVLEGLRDGNCDIFISGFETDTWKPEVAQFLNQTDIFIPLVSYDFLRSKSCRHEVDIIMGRKQRGEALSIVPFLYRYCLYADVEWLGEMPVWRGPGQFYSNEGSTYQEEHSIVNFGNKLELVLDTLELHKQ